MSRIGVVTIGRNEGQRLQRCLESLVARMPQGTPIIYVDSGSTDDSVEMAKSLGVEVVALDTSLPFTMSRGRNTGFEHLCEHHPDLEFVQFLDGDCELTEGWIDAAVEAIETDDQLAVVCGRRRERFPEASIYNRLIDIEWNTAVGETRECGGDALMRVEAIKQVGGYDVTLICGEEPEMCVRLRKAGWRIYRLDCDMTLHDAAMTRFGQWWKRSIRGGWAYAEGAAMHGDPPESHKVRERRSVWFWGLAVPLLAIVPAYFTYGLSLALLLGYPLLVMKVYRYRKGEGNNEKTAWQYASFCVLAKFPQLLGQLRYHGNRMRGRQAELIEYKSASTGAVKGRVSAS